MYVYYDKLMLLSGDVPHDVKTFKCRLSKVQDKMHLNDSIKYLNCIYLYENEEE